MDEPILWWIHERSTPLLDTIFRASHQLGTMVFCTTLVTLFVLSAMVRRRWREALLWTTLGISTYLLQKGIKVAVARPRPELWAHWIDHPSFAFPSGHALAAATFFPLVARAASHRWPDHRRLAYGAAIVMALYVGCGRLYLGVHWPTDVLAGWAIGATQTLAGLGLVDWLRARSDDKVAPC
jgi:undecaprenyl-diphosphatase